jgi:hypothetical protein
MIMGQSKYYNNDNNDKLRGNPANEWERKGEWRGG